jgi:hypothetical protein
LVPSSPLTPHLAVFGIEKMQAFEEFWGKVSYTSREVASITAVSSISISSDVFRKARLSMLPFLTSSL